MVYEKLDDGTVLTDEAVDALVEDAYAALYRGAYRVVPNPHKAVTPVTLTDERRAELLEAVFAKND